jgi:hypothetical protein
MSLIAIDYALYAKVGDEYVPVTAPADIAIETALVDADTDKQVEQFADPTQQADALHAHVLGVPFPLPVDGHVIAFDDGTKSVWNPIRRDWDQVQQGASIAYPVPLESEDPAVARLHLRVWTVNAR